MNVDLIAIEQYPNDNLKKDFSGLSKLLPEEVQKIPLSEFGKLGQNDILFIDSSHVLKIDTDVQYGFLNILHLAQQRRDCSCSRHILSSRISERIYFKELPFFGLNNIWVGHFF
jgi:hypothetical protein